MHFDLAAHPAQPLDPMLAKPLETSLLPLPVAGIEPVQQGKQKFCRSAFPALKIQGGGVGAGSLNLGDAEPGNVAADTHRDPRGGTARGPHRFDKEPSHLAPVDKAVIGPLEGGGQSRGNFNSLGHGETGDQGKRGVWRLRPPQDGEHDRGPRGSNPGAAKAPSPSHLLVRDHHQTLGGGIGRSPRHQILGAGDPAVEAEPIWQMPGRHLKSQPLIPRQARNPRAQRLGTGLVDLRRLGTLVYCRLVENWERIELFSSFLKLTGDIEVVPPLRLTDVVNRMTEYLEVRQLTLEPLASTYPVISTVEEAAMVSKRSILIIAPVGDSSSDPGGRRTLLEQKVAHQVALTIDTFSLVCEVFLEPRLSLRETLERSVDDFLAVRNLNAVWLPALTHERVTIQRPFALVHPRQILSFSERGAAAL